MNNIDPQTKASEMYCSTRKAADMLSVCLGTVQNMVESGVLEAWRTVGGHRRILVKSVQDYIELRDRGISPPPTLASSSAGSSQQTLSILLADDDPITRKLISKALESWQMPVSIEMVGNGFEGLLRLGQKIPDLLLTDLRMPGMDGFQMIKTLRADSRFSSMDIVAITGLSVDEIAREGGLPPDISIFTKPISLEVLRGFLQAKIVHILRNQNKVVSV